MPNSSIQSILHFSMLLSYLEESFCLFTISSGLVQNCPKVGFFERRRQDVDDRAKGKETLNKYSGVFY